MRVPLAAAFVFVVLLTGCETDNSLISPIPSRAVVPLGDGLRGPAPTPDDEGGVKLDEVLAVVEGKPLTLRTLVRRLGIDPAEVNDEANRREIQRETLKWAKEQVFVKAAERAGLQIQESRVDTYVEDMIEREIARATEEIGEEVTREEYLENESLTWSEYRSLKRSELMRTLFLRKLMMGIGGPTRPQIDLTVSPAEVRRVYYDHQDLFDVKPGVRLVQFKVNYEDFEAQGHEAFEATDLGIAMAEQIVADFESGMTPAEVAAKHELGNEGEGWNAAKEDQYIESFPDPGMNTWLFEPGRTPGNAKVVPVPTGLLVFGVIDQREERRVPFEEAYEDIVKRLQLGRQLRLEHTTLIELLTKGNVVWPDELADVMLAEAQDTLQKIAQEDVWKGARLR